MPAARVATGLLCGVALIVAIAVAFALPRSGPLITTYAASSNVASALDLAAGLALLAAGLLAWLVRSGGSLGSLALLASVVWFAPDWIGWEDGWPLARSLGMLVAPFGFALLIHLAFASPRGRVARRTPLAGVAAAYIAAAVVSGGRALFRDPFEDPYCWSNCTDNVFLADPDRGVADALDAVWSAAAVAAAALVTGVAAWRLVGATPAARRLLWPVMASAALAGAAEGAYRVTLLTTPAEDPDRDVFAALFIVRAVAAIGLAGGIACTVVRARRTRAAVARLGVERRASRPLRDALAGALGDPTLQVAYPLPASDRAVDAQGADVALPALGSGRAVTTIARAGEPVAVVTHDATLLDGAALEREIGAAARLAVDNERLQAALLARLADLRASRARIVETSDAERRRLERNLHDGAQQRLLALLYELRLARAAADGEAARLLATATEEAQAALGELRELAHGIYPAILAEAGLKPALQTVADDAPVPVVFTDVTSERLPAAVETAAYVLVVAGIEDAARRGAMQVEVTAVRQRADLVVVVADDGDVRGAALPEVADRVGALGGRLDLGPRTLEAAMPCE